MPSRRAKNFLERKARARNFLMFCVAKRAREWRPTTGTGNEKRRTLRKSSLLKAYRGLTEVMKKLNEKNAVDLNFLFTFGSFVYW